MSIEKMKVSEKMESANSDIPNSHTEGIDFSKLENLSVQEVSETVGENVYSNIVEKRAGIRGKFEDISGGGSKEVFKKSYSDYINHPEKLKKDNPKMYQFMKERIFHGREYTVEDVKGKQEKEVYFGCNKLDIVATSDSGRNLKDSEVAFTGNEEILKEIADLKKEIEDEKRSMEDDIKECTRMIEENARGNVYNAKSLISDRKHSASLHEQKMKENERKISNLESKLD